MNHKKIIEIIKKWLGIQRPSKILHNAGILFSNALHYGFTKTEQENKIKNILRGPYTPRIEINKLQCEEQVEIAKQIFDWTREEVKGSDT